MHCKNGASFQQSHYAKTPTLKQIPSDPGTISSYLYEFGQFI